MPQLIALCDEAAPDSSVCQTGMEGAVLSLVGELGAILQAGMPEEIKTVEGTFQIPTIYNNPKFDGKVVLSETAK